VRSVVCLDPPMAGTGPRRVAYLQAVSVVAVGSSPRGGTVPPPPASTDPDLHHHLSSADYQTEISLVVMDASVPL
jgi:hypothetical protein